MPRAQTTAFIFSQFTSRGTVHYMGLPEQDYFGTGAQPEPSYLHKKVKSGVGSICGSPLPLRKTIAASQAAKAAMAAAGRKYTFNNAADNSCVDHSDTASFTELPREFLRDIRRPSHFQVSAIISKYLVPKRFI